MQAHCAWMGKEPAYLWITLVIPMRKRFIMEAFQGKRMVSAKSWRQDIAKTMLGSDRSLELLEQGVQEEKLWKIKLEC